MTRIVSEILGNGYCIGDNDDLVLLGLDSIGSVKLVVKLEEEFGILVSDDDLLIENFNSIEKICLFIQNAIGAREKAGCGKSLPDDRKKIAIITGANRGVGYGIAQELHKSGYHVIALNRTQRKEDWFEEIECDITKYDELEKAYRYILKKYEYIDILINNAGIREFARIDKLSEKQWGISLETNLTAPLRILRFSMKGLVKAKGLVVFVGSSAAEYTFEGGTAYSCTKAALRTLTENAIKDLRYEDIRFSYISLGAIEIMEEADGRESWKIQPQDVGELIALIAKLPGNIMPAYIDIRPSKPQRASVLGLERLQYL